MNAFSKHHKPLSLSAQIRATERRVSNRRRQFGIHTAAISQKIGKQLSTPPNLLLASGIGFIIGEFTRQTPQAIDKANEGQTSKTSPLKIALNLFSSIHTLYTALPLFLIIKSTYDSMATKPMPVPKNHVE